MAGYTDAISALLHEPGEAHHRVYRILDGADPDWAFRYAERLGNLSESRRTGLAAETKR